MKPSLVSPTIPFAIACIGIATFSAMDAVMKGLSIDLGAYNAMLWRTGAGALMAGAIFLIRQEKLPTRGALRLHMLRAGVASVMAILFFWGIARVPLAEGIALSFIAPLITLYLAAVMLKEKIGRPAVIASVLGIIGVLVILSGRSGAGDHGPEAMRGIGAVFLSALLYAYNLILQRQQAQVATPSEIAFFQSLIVFTILGVAGVFAAAAKGVGLPLPYEAVIPAAHYIPAFLGAAFLAMCSLLLLSWAYARAEAQILVTVEYTAFLWAALFGWLVFSEAVTVSVLIGALLIIAGCIIAARQKPQAQPEHVEAATL
jgi:drug/metabolite transporter (DMT)-like permease